MKPIVARLHRRAASSNHEGAGDAHKQRLEPRMNAGEMHRTPNDATKVTNGVTLGEDDPTSDVERSEPIFLLPSASDHSTHAPYDGPRASRAA